MCHFYDVRNFLLRDTPFVLQLSSWKPSVDRLRNDFILAAMNATAGSGRDVRRGWRVSLIGRQQMGMGPRRLPRALLLSSRASSPPTTPVVPPFFYCADLRCCRIAFLDATYKPLLRLNHRQSYHFARRLRTETGSHDAIGALSGSNGSSTQQLVLRLCFDWGCDKGSARSGNRRSATVPVAHACGWRI